MIALNNKRRLKLENPIRNLSDFFALIARSLPDATVSANDEGDMFSLRKDSLQVDYTTQHCFQNGKTERLEVVCTWVGEGCIEKFTIQDEYDDLKDWIVEEILGYLSSIDDKGTSQNPAKYCG